MNTDDKIMKTFETISKNFNDLFYMQFKFMNFHKYENTYLYCDNFLHDNSILADDWEPVRSRKFNPYFINEFKVSVVDYIFPIYIGLNSNFIKSIHRYYTSRHNTFLMNLSIEQIVSVMIDDLFDFVRARLQHFLSNNVSTIEERKYIKRPSELVLSNYDINTKLFISAQHIKIVELEDNKEEGNSEVFFIITEEDFRNVLTLTSYI